MHYTEENIKCKNFMDLKTANFYKLKIIQRDRTHNLSSSKD